MGPKTLGSHRLWPWAGGGEKSKTRSFVQETRDDKKKKSWTDAWDAAQVDGNDSNPDDQEIPSAEDSKETELSLFWLEVFMWDDSASIQGSFRTNGTF